MSDVRERLYRHAERCPDPGCECLLWMLATRRGYGCISIDGHMFCTHRVAWSLEYGPIPDGFHVDHVHARGCRHRGCLNVAHLEAVTPLENARRWSSTITSCPQRHEYTEANTYLTPLRKRMCRACNRDAQRSYRERLRDRAAA